MDDNEKIIHTLSYSAKVRPGGRQECLCCNRKNAERNWSKYSSHRLGKGQQIKPKERIRNEIIKQMADICETANII